MSVQSTVFEGKRADKTQSICILCNRTIHNDIDWIGELRHARLYKLYKMQNIGRYNIANQIGGKPSVAVFHKMSDITMSFSKRNNQTLL